MRRMRSSARNSVCRHKDRWWEEMRNLAMITARGGSKRIPGKNIKEFCGKPILAYSIEAALKSGVFDEVMVSTDDDRIAEIAIRYGAAVPFRRSEKTAGDYATTDEVIAEVLETYAELGNPAERFCCIYPTAPFLTPERLKAAMEMLDEHESVLPVVGFSSTISVGSHPVSSVLSSLVTGTGLPSGP